MKFPNEHLPDGVGGPHRDIAEITARERCEKRHHEGKLTWLDILEEEMAEVAACSANTDSLRKELIQVAATAVRWIEDIELRKATSS